MKGRVRSGEIALVFALAVAWALLVRPGPLSLPYFWDEGDVYAPGARWLAMHGFDVTPGHFPDDWSRGHPPLFYLLVALAFRVFGTGPAIGHAVMVPFTALALAATYVFGAERGSRAIGVFAVALLGTTPLFMSMGAQVLPEMPLAALTAVALVLFSRGQLVGAAIVGVALVWIKETGVFTPLAISSGILVSALGTPRVSREWGKVARGVAVSLSPVLALIFFFVWQRATAGYFVFPHHVGLLTARPFTPLDVLTVFPSIVLWHGRWVATIAALATACFLFAKTRRVDVDSAMLALVFLCWGNAVFFTKMFWLERYALPAHPGVCVLLAVLLFEAPRRWVANVPVALAAVIGILSLHAHTDGAPEQTFGYADVVASHREAIGRVEALGGDPLVVTTWPLTTELHEPWLGFARRATRAVHPDYLELHPSTRPDIVLVDEGSTHRDELRALAHRLGLSRSLTLSFPHTPNLEIWGRPHESRGHVDDGLGQHR